MVKTAEEIAAAIRTSGVSMEAIIAALAKPVQNEGKKPAKLISNQAQAEKAEPGVHRVKGLEGVYLKKGENGSGSWFRRYWFGKKRREMGLGPLADVTLAGVRVKALEFDVQRKAGNDPIVLKRAAKIETAAQTRAAAVAADKWVFEQATESYLASHASSWKHARARVVWHGPLVKYAYPLIGQMLLDDIKVQHIDAIMTAACDNGAPKVAPRIRLRIEQILNAATALGQRNAELPNPANVKLVKAVRPAERKGASEHFRRIPLAYAPAAFRKLQALAQDSTNLSAFTFMIAAAARPGEETLKARWDEIDLDRKTWTIPASRIKTGKEHVVPLSPVALAVLERQAKVRVGDAVFPGLGGSPASYAAFSAAPEKAGIDIGTPHSWRSIFRDWAGDIGRIDRDLAEAALAHSLGAVEGAYRRQSAIEARRPVMEAYARWLAGEEANVVAFKSRE
jgi:integrase